MKIFKKILVGLLIILIAMQFFQPKRNLSAQTSSNDINLVHPVPADVKTILAKACYDCHSNNTRYPWYANIQPVAWWLNDHITEGKRHLNYSEFASYNLSKQYKKLDETAEEVKGGDMPLSSYTIIHTDAKLTEQEKQAIYNWTNAARDSMEAKYPKDSLVRKK